MNLNDKKELEAFIAQFPVYQYNFINPQEITFTERVRWICKTQCVRYGKSWSCPPGVGTVDSCAGICRSYPEALFFSSLEEAENVLDFSETMKKKQGHEDITYAIENQLKAMGFDVFTLSSDSCSICENCAYPGSRCRHPDQMHPCIESQGIVAADLTERANMDYFLDQRTLIWFSLIFFRKSQNAEKS
ncbi:MAG: DUF2284 domain-containing protein [Eubacterium sp.]|nr:DUF2284 domain-containing protein [Eubacterium sp.]